MKSNQFKKRTVGGIALFAWAIAGMVLVLSILEHETSHWRGCLIMAASVAVTASLAWLIHWMMPSESDVYSAGYRAGEYAERQRKVQESYGMVINGRTGTASVIPLRPVRHDN